jgi:hypothetical protein
MKKAMYVLSLAFGLTVVSANFSEAKAQWSHTKKNTVIGAGAGAAAGAIVSHKKAKGALIGGAIGAGAGYIHGRHKDKKYGKYGHKPA